MKKIKKYLILGIKILIGVIFIKGAIQSNDNDKSEYFIPEYILNNPNNTAIKIVRNDTVLVSHNENKLMPLASTVKIIIAVEFAFQVDEKLINPDSIVSISEIDKYYIPRTDGGAHAQWKRSITGKSIVDSISLMEIAIGMIRYSSNANTEYLLDVLGLDKVNQRITKLDINSHDPIYYLTSSQILSYVAFPELLSDEILLLDSLSNLTSADIQLWCDSIHEQLKKEKFNIESFQGNKLSVQKIWSDNLPRSTVKEYSDLLSKINSKSYFKTEIHKTLDKMLEGLMLNATNRKWLKHAGQKGGETKYVLTNAAYGTTLTGNKTEIVFFLNDLENSRKFRKHTNILKLKILNSKEFRAEIVEMFKK